jgi:hypothetical protein
VPEPVQGGTPTGLIAPQADGRQFIRDLPGTTPGQEPDLGDAAPVASTLLPRRLRLEALTRITTNVRKFRLTKRSRRLAEAVQEKQDEEGGAEAVPGGRRPAPLAENHYDRGKRATARQLPSAAILIDRKAPAARDPQPPGYRGKRNASSAGNRQPTRLQHPKTAKLVSSTSATRPSGTDNAIPRHRQGQILRAGGVKNRRATIISSPASQIRPADSSPKRARHPRRR